jgi:rfaE bifunctional protein nucleotidyltransferase chain/domain/rfaE bifunctional protein kinase chain/domain
VSPSQPAGRSALTADLPARIAASSPSVLVLGDALLDVWLTGESRRLCREAPVPVIDVNCRHSAPGGAANTAVNFAALGADVTLVAVLGDDQEAGLLRRLLSAAGVRSTGLVVDPGWRTPVKQRLVAGDALVARYDTTPQRPPGRAAAQATVTAFDAALRADPATAVVVVDYGLGTLVPALAEELSRRRAELALLVVDAHELGGWAPLRPDLVTPNVAEAAVLLDSPPLSLAPGGGDRITRFAARREALLAATGAESVALTADRDGALLLTGSAGVVHRTWAEPAPELQAAGAGDAFVAALTLGTVTGLEPASAIELAQAAADVAVRRPGTSVCTSAALADRLRSHRAALLDDRELARLVAEHRDAGRRIVFTNGCFDVLHRGHVAYLSQAKQLGDVLIVAVNDDASVRRLKGESRPVNPVLDRVAVLAALSCVDHVAVFTEDTPARLIKLVRPDAYAKGGDYTPEMLPETPLVRSLGGQVHVLDYLPDRSTTRIVNRIRAGTSG